jgi:hypothetical protein
VTRPEISTSQRGFAEAASAEGGVELAGAAGEGGATLGELAVAAARAGMPVPTESGADSLLHAVEHAT